METCQSQVQPAPRPQSSNARPASENNNNITLSFPQQQLPQACGDNVKAITLQPQPIKLQVDTSTDWPLVGATFISGFSGAMVALAVGLMAYFGSRNQVRSSRAEFRRIWQHEFKEFMGKFITRSVRIQYELRNNKNYFGSSESGQFFDDLVESKVRVDLMLDNSDKKFNEVKRLMSLLLNVIGDEKSDDIGNIINDLRAEANIIVEKTWVDIRKDINGGLFG